LTIINHISASFSESITIIKVSYRNKLIFCKIIRQVLAGNHCFNQQVFIRLSKLSLKTDFPAAAVEQPKSDRPPGKWKDFKYDV
jgi:hypothetical protein